MMSRIFKALLFFSLTIFSFISFADTTSAANQLQPLLNNIKSLQANFVQTVYDRSGSVLQQTSGQMSLLHPGKFRWETNKPSKQLLIADGSQVWFYDVELAQVMQQKQQTNTSNSPAMLLSGSVTKLMQDYKVTQLPAENNDQLIFRLIPRAKNGLFQSVDLTFAQDNLKAMRMMDNLGQTTTIKFSNVHENIALNENLFHFVLPKGVDVVKQ